MSLRTALFLTAIHACFAASSFAGFTVDVIPLPSTPLSVNHYLLRLTATEGARVHMIRGLRADDLDQVWENPISDSAQTPHAIDFEGALANPAWAAADTHLLPLPNYGTSAGFGIEETNDGLNPNGYELTPSHPLLTDYKGVAGKGTLRFVDTYNSAKNSEATMVFLDPQPRSIDLLHLALPREGYPLIRFHAVDSNGHEQYFELFFPDCCSPSSVLGATPAYGSTIEFGTVDQDTLLEDAITLNNDASNPFDIYLRSATIVGPDAHLFELIGFERGELSIGEEPVKYDVRFLGGEPGRTYEAQLQINYSPHPVETHILSYTLRASVVPEPAGWSLLALAMLVAACWYRRQ